MKEGKLWLTSIYFNRLLNSLRSVCLYFCLYSDDDGSKEN